MLVLNGVSHPRSTSRSYLLRSILPAVYLRPPLATIWRINLRSSSCMMHLLSHFFSAVISPLPSHTLFLRLGSLCIPDRSRTAEPFPCRENVSPECRFA